MTYTALPRAQSRVQANDKQTSLFRTPSKIRPDFKLSELRGHMCIGDKIVKLSELRGHMCIGDKTACYQRLASRYRGISWSTTFSWRSPSIWARAQQRPSRFNPLLFGQF